MDEFRRRPDLRAPGGGKHLHLDRLTFLEKVQQLIPECLRDLYERAASEASEEEALAAWSAHWNLVDDWVLDAAQRTYRIYADPAKHLRRRRRQVRIFELNRDLMYRGKVPRRPSPFGSDPFEPPYQNHPWADTSEPLTESAIESIREPACLRPPYERLRWLGGVRKSLPDLTHKAIRDFPLLRRPAAPFEFSQSYDPEVDSRSERRERLLRKWKTWADAQEAKARDEGAEEPVRKRGRTGDATLHFAWAARWQVDEESYAEIGQQPGPGISVTRSRQTVREAVLDVCRRIELTRRSK